MSMTVMSEGTTHCAIAMHPCIKWAINLYNLSTKILPNLTAPPFWSQLNLLSYIIR